MATAGPNNGGTFADDASVGTVAWSNPSNAQTSNDARATATSITTNVVSHYLKATNFGFSIPSGATIDGILVEIERSASTSNNNKDNSIKIVKGGTIQGNEKAVADAWPTTDAYASYGGAADLWGLTWTPTDINAADFGVVVSAQSYSGGLLGARVDHIRITIYYTDVVNGTLTAAVCTATAASPNATMGISASLQAVAAQATGQSLYAVMSGDGLLVAALAQASALSPNAMLGVSGELIAALAQATALSPQSVLSGGASLLAALAQATGQSPAASLSGGATLLAALAQATALSPDAVMRSLDNWAVLTPGGGAPAAVPAQGGGGIALPPPVGSGAVATIPPGGG